MRALLKLGATVVNFSPLYTVAELAARLVDSDPVRAKAEMQDVERLAREHEVLITVEEGSVGGFGSFVLQHLALRGMLDHGLKIRPLCLPDRFIDHENPKKQYDEAGLNAAQIVAAAVAALGSGAAVQPVRA